MANEVVNLNAAVNPYQADLTQIAQRQKLADLLQQQTSSPEQTFSYNGIQAPISATAGLNKILSGALAGYMSKKNIDAQKDLSTKAQTDASDWITKLTQGTPAQATVPGSVAATPADVEDRQQGIDMGSGAQPMTSGQAIPVPGGQGEGANVGSPAVAGGPLTDSQRMAVLMQGMNNPLTQTMAGPMAMQEMQRQRLLASLGGGQPPTGAPPAANPPSGSPSMPAGGPSSSGMPMPGPGGSPMPTGSSPQSQTGPGSSAGGIPMATWLAIDPTGAKYMEQLAKDNAPQVTRNGVLVRDPNNPGAYKLVGGVMNPGSLPITVGPDGKPMIAPLPGQIQSTAVMAGATEGAKERAKFPYSNVTTPGGASVPAFTVPGLVPSSNPSTTAPSSAAAPTAAPNLPASPAPAVTSQPIAAPKSAAQPMVGQTTADKTYGEEAGKSGVEYENNINNAASGAVTQNRMLDELSNSLQDMNPGKLAAVQKSIAEWKVATGLGDDNDKKIAASSEVTDKLTGQLVSSALKNMTARPTQAEFSIFLNKFVPNMNMTPQGANQVVNFMRQQNNLNAQKQPAFQAWKQNQPVQNYRNFETIWNQQMAASPLSTGSSFGAPENPQPPSKTLNWNDLPNGR